jgi:hypothetical protein
MVVLYKFPSSCEPARNLLTRVSTWFLYRIRNWIPVMNETKVERESKTVSLTIVSV